MTTMAFGLGKPNPDQNCKKSIWLHARLIVAQRWYNSFNIFLVPHVAFQVPEDFLTDLLSFKFETTQCENHLYIDLVEIHLAVIEIA